MPENRLPFLFAVAVVASGCSSRQEAVYVDMNRVAASELLVGSGAPNLPPTPQVAMEQVNVGLPGLPPRVVVFQDTQARLDIARQETERNQRRASEEARRNLRRAYQAQALQDMQGLRDGLVQEREAAYREALVALEQLIQEFGEQRREPLTRLTFLAGFPDPDPESLATTANPKSWRARRLEEAARLRQALNALTNQMRQEAQAVLQTVTSEFDALSTAIEARIQTVIQEYLDRADRESELLFQQATVRLRSMLSGIASTTLPEVPGSSLTIAGSGGLLPPPAVEVPAIIEASEARLESDLQIWLAINNAARSPLRSGVRDATEEFIAWRRRHQAGL